MTARPPWSASYAGGFEESWFDSQVLRGNRLHDPHVRPLWVYLPPGYDAEPERRYPSIYLLQGLTGQLDMWRNRSAFRQSVPEMFDQLFASGEAPPCILVWVDCWTSVGGSQFLDSPGTGRYHTYLCEEIVPWVDARYRTLAAREHRGVAGKSSGGYGAMVTPMLRPDLFSGLATHAGDALFEACYLPEFRQSARALRDEYGGSFDAFWADFRSRPAFSKKSDDHLLNDWCMASCYSTDPPARSGAGSRARSAQAGVAPATSEYGEVHLPYDIATGELVPEVWTRWLAVDPVRMVSERAEAMRSMRAIYIDAGTRDEWYLDLGAEAFRRALAAVGVSDVFFELFEAGHGRIEYRYPIGLRYLAERLTP